MTQTPSAPSPRENSAGLLRWLLVVLAALAVVAVAVAFLLRGVLTPSAEPDAAAISESGYPAPDFRIPTLDSGLLGPPDFPKQVVVVEFWATWCGPCFTQADYLKEINERWADRGVQILAVNVGESEGKVRNFVTDSPFPYPVLLDTDETIFGRFGVNGLPTVMVVDTQGAISYLHVGLTGVDRLEEEIIAAGAA
ncbi:MAG: TlpA disulfide reductase family protein [Acidobacteriota bacterium]